MTPSQLKAEYQRKHPDGHFFDRKTMAFFGDTMKNFGVVDFGSHWKLYRKRAVKHGIKTAHYFHKETLDDTTNPFRSEEDEK